MYEWFEIARVLVIAPKRVAEDTWSRESEKWDHLNHLTISKILGDEKHRLEGMTAEEARRLIIKNQILLPYPIRLEDGVSWLHLDVYNADKGKVYLFKV